MAGILFYRYFKIFVLKQCQGESFQHKFRLKDFPLFYFDH